MKDYGTVLIPVMISILSAQVNWERTDSTIVPGMRSGHGSVVFNNRLWILGGAQTPYVFRNDVWSSADGYQWNQSTPAAPWSARTDLAVVAHNNRLWVIGGQQDGGWLRDVWSSPDGVNWDSVTTQAPWTARAGHRCLSFEGRLWLLGGRDGSGDRCDVWSSADGRHWTLVTDSAPWLGRSAHSAIVYDNRLWLLGGNRNGYGRLCDVWYSDDGTNWTRATDSAGWSARDSMAAVVHNDAIWILGGRDNTARNDVWLSTDGMLWTRITAGANWSPRAGHQAVSFQSRIWLTMGNPGGPLSDEIWSSDSGVVWTRAGLRWSSRALHSGAAFADRIWVLGGALSTGPLRDAWSSPNGWAWTQSRQPDWPARQNAAAVTHNSRLWIMGGFNLTPRNDVWYSSDGNNWTQATSSAQWSPRQSFAALSFGNRIWVLGGSDFSGMRNDVWSSADGVNWSQATASAPWARRDGFGALVYNGRMWIMGGATQNSTDDNPDTNDVWYSSDGVSWIQATPRAPWTPRHDFAVAVYADRMWIMGGASREGLMHDVWWSRDGVNWIRLNDAPWSGRTQFPAVADVAERLWVLGGYDSIGLRSDIWSLRLADVGCHSGLTPSGTAYYGARITPACSVYNYGGTVATYTLNLTIGTEYDQTVAVISHPPGTMRYVTFPAWNPSAIGSYSIKCSTALNGDWDLSNDWLSDSVLVIINPADTGWHALEPLPEGPKGKKLKDGGRIAYNFEEDSTCYIYALKGNNTLEFYKYNTATNLWATRESIPAVGRTGKKKAVKKGSVLVGDIAETRPLGGVFAAKGNGTLEWWFYNPYAAQGIYPWSQKADIPEGTKPLKEGASACVVEFGTVEPDTGYVYLLKGSGTYEFYCYKPVPDAWFPLPDAPAGVSGKPYKKGSAICYNDIPGEPKIVYVLKGSYNEFYAYNVDSQTWTTLKPLPFKGWSGKKTKAGEGAAIACRSGFVRPDRSVYALKGNNTLEFWRYSADSDTWVQLADVPSTGAKKVKGGGSLVYSKLNDRFYATKGNGTTEFYTYWQYADFSWGRNITGASAPNIGQLLRITPNPFRQSTTINYRLPTSGNVRLGLYDATGRLVMTLANGYQEEGNYHLAVTGNRLARGIYLLRLITRSGTTTAKMIVE